MKNEQNIQKRFKELLERFQAGTLAESELGELKSLFNDESASAGFKTLMIEEIETDNYPTDISFDKNKLYQNIENQLDFEQSITSHKVSKTPVVRYLFQIAAVLVLTLFASGLTVYFLNGHISNYIQLTSYFEVTAPYNAKKRVVLPDSSIVWLNAGSKLTYTSNFNRKNRLVYLEGEGYFQISRNKNLPFIVDAFGFLVEGGQTEFNVKAYNDEPIIEAILVEGKVWLNHRTETIASDISLGRKYKATFYKQLSEAALSHGQPRLVISPNVDPTPLISWKNNQYIHQKSELMDEEHEKYKNGENLVILFDRKNKFLAPDVYNTIDYNVSC